MEAAQYNCPDAPSNESSAERRATLGTKQGMPQKGSVLQFTGRQCGLDLILWESVDVLSSFPPCRVNLALRCGETPHGEHLPRSCKNIGMPATFIASQKGDGANAVPTEDEASKQRYLMKFFENGEYSVEGLESDVSSSSKIIKWRTDVGWKRSNTQLLINLYWSDNSFVQMLLAAPKDGSKFDALVGRTVTAVIAVTALPLWWTFKFQQDEMLRGHGTAFNTDSLDECEMSYFWNGTCFEIKVGSHVQILSAPDGYCPKHHTKKEAGDKYHFRASTYGTQMYRSLHSCLPFAAHREFHFEIVDVRSQNAFFLSSGSSVAESKCRTALRLAVDIQNFKCHRTEDWDFDTDDFDFD
eukprot:symbB.v1.2.038766.t1/scaffold5842.1/size23188/2